MGLHRGRDNWVTELKRLSFNFLECVPVLLENEHGLSCTGACCSWMELAFSVGMYPFVWDLVYHYSLGPGVLWWSKVLELSYLPLAFGPPLSVTSRLLFQHCTGDKTPRLWWNNSASWTVKEIHSVIYRKEEGELDRGDQEEKRKSKRKRAIKPVIKSLSENIH